jgi:ubiquinone/menaquinone biosynthesis C-methylase UbiE
MSKPIPITALTDSVDDMMNRMFVDAGIGPGMKILDVGCGRGDVSLLVSKLTGETGMVLGVDRDASSIEFAQNRVKELNISNISFSVCDIMSLFQIQDLFDAAVARRVIMYLQNPVEAIKKISGMLRPGGIVALLEHDATMVPGRFTPLALQEEVNRWILETVKREGADVHIGFNLNKIMEQAGIIVEHIRAEAIIQTPQTSYPTVPIIRAMLPRIIQTGVATEEAIDIETLEQRLLDERNRNNSIYVSDMVFTIWGRKPGIGS